MTANAPFLITEPHSNVQTLAITLHHAVVIHVRHRCLTCHKHFTLMCITSAHTGLWATQMLCLQAQVKACCNSILKQSNRALHYGQHCISQDMYAYKSKNDTCTNRPKLFCLKPCTHFPAKRHASWNHILLMFGLTKWPIWRRRLPTKKYYALCYINP
jgi:hypothetical protein